MKHRMDTGEMGSGLGTGIGGFAQAKKPTTVPCAEKPEPPGRGEDRSGKRTSVDSACDAFLLEYWADEESGRIRGLRHYLDRFPGNEEAVARKYLQLRNQPLGASTATGVGPGEVLGNYRLEEEIGRGGQGVVYRGVHLRTGRRVAVKVLRGFGAASGRLLAYFKREAEAAARLDHPGLCPVYDAEISCAVPYLAMRLVEGTTLRDRIGHGFGQTEPEATSQLFWAEGTNLDRVREPHWPTGSDLPGPCDVSRLVALGEQLAGALHAAHQAGIIHRDIKPGNIIVTPEGQGVITDFGLAQGDEPGLTTLTRTGDMCGTLAYMSPEQLGDRSQTLDRRTDIWSLGVTLYECLTLRRPFDAPTREALHQHILMRDPPNPRNLNSAVSRDLATVVLTALEKDRERRYQSAEDLAEDLGRIRRREPIRALPPTVWTRLSRWAQRNPDLTTSLVATLLVLVAGLVACRFLVGRARFNELKALEHASRADQAAGDARRQLRLSESYRAYLYDVLLAPHPENAGGDGRMVLVLADQGSFYHIVGNFQQAWTFLPEAWDICERELPKQRMLIAQLLADLARAQAWTSALGDGEKVAALLLKLPRCEVTRRGDQTR